MNAKWLIQKSGEVRGQAYIFDGPQQIAGMSRWRALTELADALHALSAFGGLNLTEEDLELLGTVLRLPPSEAELGDMERQFEGERAVRDALDDEQAHNETPGGVD